MSDSRAAAINKMRIAVKSLLLAAAVFAATASEAAFEVYFLRHGETLWNRAHILQGSVPYTGLTDRGVRMAKVTGEGMAAAGLRFERIYTSPFVRARSTAEYVSAATGPAPVDDVRIREMCFGVYEGMKYSRKAYPDENLRLFFEDPERYVPAGKGAESFADVGARVRDFLERELKPLDGKVKRILCVSHSLVLKTIVREFAGEGASEEAKKPIQRNCCVHVLRYENGRFSLKETGRIFYDPADFEQGGPLMVAHRGAGDLTMPEATLPAYSNAVATGCNIVKFDLLSTRDGVVVMGHDLTLKRNMGWDVKVADVDYAEIFAKGRFLDAGGKPGEQRIVRLDEALRITEPVPEFWLDFKYFTPEFADRVMALVAERKIHPSRLMVATFNLDALRYMKEKYGSVRRVRHVSFQAAKRSGALADVMRSRAELGLFGVNMPVLSGQTRKEDVEMLSKSGLWVSLWFVQNREKSAYCKGFGADAFVTDHVSAVRGGL